MVSTRELIDAYNKLDSAVFFDGIGEFLMNEKYSPETWRREAESFLNIYQDLLQSNVALAKHDYLLQMEYDESRAELLDTNSPRLTRKLKDRNENSIDFDDETLEMLGDPNEPFDGYFELMNRMALPAEALKKTLDETDESILSPKIPARSEIIKEIGGFTFILEDDTTTTGIKYGAKPLKNLTPKLANTFFCIMNKCYEEEGIITVNEIAEFNKTPSDDSQYISSIISKINQEIREVTKKQGRLIVHVGKKKQSHETQHITSYKINYEFLTNI